MNMKQFLFAFTLIISFNVCSYYIRDLNWEPYGWGPRDRRLILEQESRKVGGKFTPPFVAVGSAY